MYHIFHRQCEDAIAVLQNDNEQLEQEKSALKERLKQLTKTKLVDDIIQKKVGTTQRTSGILKDSCLCFIIQISLPIRLHS